MQRSYPLVAITCCCAGAALFYVAAIFVGGVLAAAAIPAAYFQWFGREHVNLALALMFAATWSLPVAAMVAAGVVGILLVAGRLWQVGGVALLGGMVCTFLYWQVQSALLFAQSADAESGFTHAFFQSFAATWPSAPNLAAPWLGFALGVWVVSCRRRKEQSGARVA
jgi:hypothetical protein